MNTVIIKNLLSWMEKNLNPQSQFSEKDLGQFFAKNFVIKTNSRVVNANLTTYKEYLYGLKSRLKGVQYEINEFIEAEDSVIVPFIIELSFQDKKPQRLQTISIFKMDKNNRILEWEEVFANADEEILSYD